MGHAHRPCVLTGVILAMLSAYRSGYVWRQELRSQAHNVFCRDLFAWLSVCESVHCFAGRCHLPNLRGISQVSL